MIANSTSLSVVAPKHFVRFYQEDRALTDFVAQFVESGLGAGGAAIVVATPGHIEVLVGDLERAGINVERARATHRLFLLDARTTLDALMLDGMPDPKRFRAVVLEALVPAMDGGTTVRAFGEMVDLLWQDGNEPAALELERLWNQLAVEHEFALLCGYRDRPTKQSSDKSLADVCRLHSHVVKSNGDVSMGDPSAAHDAVLQLLSTRAQVLGWQRDEPTNGLWAGAKLDWTAVARTLADRATAKLFVLDRGGFVRLWSGPLASALGLQPTAIVGRIFTHKCSAPGLLPIIRSTLARAWLSPLHECAIEVIGGDGRKFVLTVSSDVIGRRSQQALLLTVGEVRALYR
jgi:hypothetical protein